MEKKILDVTCGSRTIWFNKNHPNAVYCDRRIEAHYNIWKNDNGKAERACIIDPDIQCDFTNLPFADNVFSLVVFDPPHLIKANETAWLVKKYSKLDESWPQMLHDGFAEYMRVLKPDGVLIFKWSEYDIPAEKVWKAIGQKPLFGHHSGKKSNTFWGCFMKGAERWVFYAIYVAEGVVFLAVLIAVIAGVAYAAVKVASLFGYYSGEDDEDYIKIRKISKNFGTVALVAAILATFVPGEKTITKMIVAQNVTYERVETVTDVVQTVYEDIMSLFEEEESE